MVTKTKRPAPKPAAPTRRVGAHGKTSGAGTVTDEPVTEAAKPNLLRAGLKALGNVRDDVVQHQSRVFEAILGIDPAHGWSSLIKRDAAAVKGVQEALGLRKFEAVFDQRVAHALERIGMPSIEALQALTEEVAALKAELRRLKAAPRKR
jgi:Poly(hydroxyalcanoate) granule associated protein (phasin)